MPAPSPTSCSSQALPRGGDFKANPEAKDAEKLLETHDCNTLESDQYEDQKRTTAGALFMVSACGLFIGEASACAPLPPGLVR